MTKTISARIKNALQDRTMTLPSGDIANILEVFFVEDFSISDEEIIFIKHAPLLRTAKKILGGIVARKSSIIQYPEQSNDWSATVCVQYKFGCGVTWSAVADCRRKTAPQGFSNYTVAMAETRASARCLREAMGIEICSAEEIVDMDNLNQIRVSATTTISDIQVAALEKFVAEGKTSLKFISEILDKKVIDLKDLTRTEGEQLMDVLNS